MKDKEEIIRDSIQREGLFKEFALSVLVNTGNNRVYRLQAPEGDFIVKHYFQHPDDPRDRFATERSFYAFLGSAGIRRTPKPVSWLPDERISVIEFVNGNKPTNVAPALVGEALDFFSELNQGRHLPAAEALPAASEACFSVATHLDCIERRVQKLSRIEPAADIDREAIEFISGKITPAWHGVVDGIKQRFSPQDIESELPFESRCISPSDFGFHNSIQKESGNLRFFDFEYAGWDDPAKTICDFFCQPQVPVDHAWFGEFLAGFLESFPGTGLEGRAKLLLPLYQIKWGCIMLNDFLPVGNQRRAFSNPDEQPSDRKAKQLLKAEAYLNTRNYET